MSRRRAVPGPASGSSSSPPGCFGTAAVADMVKTLEGDEEAAYDAQDGSPEVAAIAADEREHAVIWDRLKAGDQIGQVTEPGRDGVAIARRATSAAEVGRRESWHRADGRSGTLRAVIFGVSDGLVSNLALVMGVAGAASGNPSFILLAGVAGLLAGAFSMAAGEYISMQSQRELFERQIALERAEMEAMPEEEEAELAAAYRAKGFSAAEAARIAHRIFEDPDTALDMLVQEELGLDREQLGSPLGAAGGSFVAFAIGASIPVLPVSHRRWHERPDREPRAEPPRALRGRCGGQPADRSRAHLLRAPAADDRPGRRPGDLRHRIAHRRDDDRLTDGRRPCPTSARRGPRPFAMVQRAGRSVRRPRARLRQGHRRRPRVDPVRPGRAGSSTWPAAIDSNCRPGRGTTPSSDRPG